MKRLFLSSILLALIFCLYSCEEPVVTVSSITLNSTALDMTEGDSYRLTATVLPDNATDKTVIWSSSNASIASVEDGVVTAVKEGAATITVASKDGGARAACEVMVAAKVIDVESISLSQKEATITVGESLTLKATVLPDKATDKTVTWTSNNTSVATVSDGVVKAVGAGSASITATAGGKNATCTITVKEAVIAVTSVTLSKTSLSLLEGEKATLTATVSPSDATDKTVTWTSSNEKVLTVYDGTVTAVKAGTATVTATAGDKSATCEVQVSAKVPVSEVVLDIKKLTIEVGQTETLTATVLPDNATDKTVRWTSSDDDIATVRGGQVTGVGEGTATITATAGEKSANCLVTVKFVAVDAIELNMTELTLNPDESENLQATVYPENASDKTVTWSSSDASVAKVTDYGRVTAIKTGTAVITAQAGDAKATCTVKVNNNNYLTITNEGKSSGQVRIKAGNVNAPSISLVYSNDNGRTWNETGEVKATETIEIPIPTNGTVRLYGDNAAYGRNIKSKLGWWTISATVNHSVSGDLMSLSSYSKDTNEDYQFYKLFCDDTKLVSAENLRLSAKELTAHCYESMFEGCTALKEAPVIQAAVLAASCFKSMFEKCTSLLEAPKLSSTVMAKADRCYESMFKGCTSLTKAPKLPATIMAVRCYASMFQGCTALQTAPELPSVQLANYCYQSMFQGCTALQKAPELNATTMAAMCYQSMFQDCSSLQTAPELPAKIMATGCYYSMFQDCSSLAKAPELPATTMVTSCYHAMFMNCVKLTEAPELPATKLATSCYASMFANCYNIKKAPVLPAEKLADKCYQKLFHNCRYLNSITCLATDISASDCTEDWLFYTAENGTFIKSPDIRIPEDEADETKQTWTRGPSGIPLNWKVENYDKGE